MRATKALGNLLGVGSERSAQPPRYVALADGLLVTEEHAEAWYLLDSSNTDLMSVEARDAEHDEVCATLAKTLSGYECHLRIVWTPLQAQSYRAEGAELFTTGRWQEWVEDRVERLDQLALPTRHLLLAVRISERNSQNTNRLHDALGTGTTGISKRELARLDAVMRRLGRRLEASPWRAQEATAEMLSWMVAREQHRDAPLPSPNASGAITGAKLHQLTRGRAIPYSDHVQVLDGQGETAAWVSVLTMPSFPEELESPGQGEWLRTLAEITYVPDLSDEEEDDDLDAMDLPVNAEASVRFKVIPKKAALKQVEEARKSAKEQRQSAARHSAEDTSLDNEETEGVMSELARQMRRQDVTLVTDHPRIVVASDISLEDLRARIDAVAQHYGGLGIDVLVGEDEQRDLWLETLPGDRVRVGDLGHIRDVAGLAGSWFWGGARVGDDHGPIIGYLTGTTSGAVRADVTAGSERGDATSTALIGRSGRGKTTGAMLSMLDAAFAGAAVFALDFKGDLGGVTVAAQHYGLPAHLVSISEQYAGVADLFGLLEADGAEQAAIHVPAQLGIAVPPHLRARGAEVPIQEAVNATIRAGEPATWKVIEYLRHAQSDLAKETGEALHELAQTALGGVFMGRPVGNQPLLRPEPGIWVVQMPGLSLPSADTEREDWNVLERMSVALMHSMLAYGITTAGRPDLRGLRKLVAVPEVHVLTATREGAAFLDYIARVGRALSTSLLVDTQDCDALLKLVGVIEQLSTIYGFQLTSEPQQDALAALLKLPVGPHTRRLIQSIGVTRDGSIRHGHCIALDWRERAATMQWDIPSLGLMKMLDTTPRAQEGGTGPNLIKPEVRA
ncbi:ATP-binding protein [Streptomyces lydicus]|uniref:ATP-binding protein n=1 Tax=Streptomyces lydicus TaxID=47763 RepID=UPI00379189E0